MGKYFTLEELGERGAATLMRMLVDAAHRKEKITYGQVADRFKKFGGSFVHVSPKNVGYVAGSVMERILEVAPGAPPINTLVIDKTTRLPGDGASDFVASYMLGTTYEKLSNQKKREVLLPVFEKVFSYSDWPKVARLAFGIKAVELSKKKLIETEHDGKDRRIGFGGPAESPEHLRLKTYVVNHPRMFGAPKKSKKGIPEKALASRDEIDVWFMVPGHQVAIEVKSERSSQDDLKRGIYQCVKYKALLEAEARWELKRELPKVDAKLVSENALSKENRRLARALGVDVITIKPLGQKLRSNLVARTPR
ncbi:MAG: hypothetical protein ACOY91_10535 [Pseudomonadota bacterium]